MVKNKTKILFINDNDFNLKFKNIFMSREIDNFEISKSVSKIINQIKDRGDTSLVKMIKKFDNIIIDNMQSTRVEHKLLKSAFQKSSKNLKSSLITARIELNLFMKSK